MAEPQPDLPAGGTQHDGTFDLLYPFYLDTDMSMAFAAAITGGVSLEEEQIDRLTDTSRAVKALRGNLKVWRAGEIGGGRESANESGTASESRSIRRHTDASIFITLYDELRRTGSLHVNPTFDDLEVGSLATLDMGPAVAPLRRVLDQIRRLLDVMAPVLGLDAPRNTRGATATQQRSKHRPVKEVDPERSEALRQYQSLKNLFDALSDDLQQSGLVDIAVDRGDLPPAVLTLDRRFVSEPTLELLHTSRFTVVGKISQIWPDPGEFVNMYRRSVLSLVPALAQSTAWGLFGLLGAMGKSFDVAAMQRSANAAVGITSPEGAPTNVSDVDTTASPSADEAPVSGDEEGNADREASAEQPQPGADVMLSPEAIAALLPGIATPAFQILPLAICS
jgi:hypothetical protein